MADKLLEEPFPLSRHTKSIMAKLAEVVRGIEEEHPEKFIGIVLVGSRARGTAKDSLFPWKRSDIDLRAYYNTSEDESQDYGTILKIEEKIIKGLKRFGTLHIVRCKKPTAWNPSEELSQFFGPGIGKHLNCERLRLLQEIDSQKHPYTIKEIHPVVWPMERRERAISLASWSLPMKRFDTQYITHESTTSRWKWIQKYYNFHFNLAYKRSKTEKIFGLFKSAYTAVPSKEEVRIGVERAKKFGLPGFKEMKKRLSNLVEREPVG